MSLSRNTGSWSDERPVDVSEELREWAGVAGYRVEQGSQTHDGRTVLWTPLGEVRFFIAQRSGGFLAITTSERMGEERFSFGAASLNAVERFFFSKFGLAVRDTGLPLLRYPASPEDVAAGYQIEPTSYEGKPKLALIDSTGSLVAIASGDALVGNAELAELSLTLAEPVEAIKASYLDPAGEPLFEPRKA